MQESHSSADNDHARISVNGVGNHATSSLDDFSHLNGADASLPITTTEDDTDSITVSESRGKKRKLHELSPSKRDRRPSPPWKKIAAEGPTSFVDAEGRRKSTRTNNLTPQPSRTSKRKSEAKPTRKNGRSLYSTPKPAVSAIPKAKTNGHVPSSKSRDLSKPVPTKRSSRLSAISRASAADSSTIEVSHDSGINNRHHPSPDSQRKIRLRLTSHRSAIPILNFQNVPRPKKHGGLAQFLAQDDACSEGDFTRFTTAKAREEAEAEEKVLQAGREGGLLTEVKLMEHQDPQASQEPPVPFSHPDYLAKHAEDLLLRVVREGKEHRSIAKRIAIAAAAEAIKRQPETEEQKAQRLLREAIASFKNSMKELERHWSTQKYKIDRIKVVEYEQERDEAARQQMRGWLERSEKRVAERQHLSLGDLQDVPSSELEDTEVTNDIDDDDDEDDEESEDGSESSEDDDDDDLTDDTESDDGENEGQDDELDVEALRRKYANLDDAETDNAAELSPPDTAALPNGHIPQSPKHERSDLGFDPSLPDDKLTAEQLQLKYANLPDLADVAKRDPEDGDDEEDSDDYGSDDDETEESEATSEEGSDDGDQSDQEEEQSSLLGFFSKKDIKTLADDDHDEEMKDANDSSQPLLAESKVDPSDPDAALDIQKASSPSADLPEEVNHDQDLMQMADPLKTTAGSEPGHIKLEPPALLRGTLRMYQQYGLEWLAGMYANDTNGILADEMGLGKTIQTISLLAWLACERHIWGPHLIIVPTSVLLNWEMEFKKFCPGFKIMTYYGTLEERAQKRKGWMDETKWHVCITSYQLAVSDAPMLKRRNWHYMILDEAHNIKNFRSQRWQTLLSFKTQARLLLTGTPLQNNLTELWSLLFFLSPQTNEKGETEFGELAEFSKNFNKPVEQILNQGRDSMDDEARNVVIKLHKVLRPHLLRRLKKDVEKQMPKKYEHVTLCRLSKRQRQLYDGYMRLADTRESFASGNYMSIINCLMQLRKVCNHPDLFETRQIVTSYAMKRPVMADYDLKEHLVRHKLFGDSNDNVSDSNLLNIWRAPDKFAYTRRSRHDHTLSRLAEDVKQRSSLVPEHPVSNGQSLASAMDVLRNVALQAKLDYRQKEFETTAHYTSRKPLYREKLLSMLTLNLDSFDKRPSKRADITEMFLNSSQILSEMVTSLPQRALTLKPYIQRFACVTPAVTVHGMNELALTSSGMSIISNVQSHAPSVTEDPYHEALTRLSIAFPDKSLIQYDCGKLQQLDKLLRRLQSGGHRALIFTQMTKVLDILEQFLNLHGHRYLRLDGSTKIEQRLALTERFNSDTRILAFIASSRSGGLGINLTGADTVIFYDLDWNPAMDKQCQDRCHRIGQTRDVHIYRFVSEGTIEANILRKSNQKRMLDDVVIQEGGFTTDYFNRLENGDLIDDGRYGDSETSAALDKVFGGGQDQPMERVFEQAEDQEDREAAKKAEKEDVQIDGEDFEERAERAAAAAAANAAGTSSTAARTPRSSEAATPASAVNNQSEANSPAPASTPTPSAVAVVLSPAAEGGQADEQAHEDQGDEEEEEEEVEEEEMAPEDLSRPIRGVGDWMFEYLKWEMRDVKYIPPSDRARKKAKKGKDFGIPKIRR